MCLCLILFTNENIESRRYHWESLYYKGNISHICIILLCKYSVWFYVGCQYLRSYPTQLYIVKASVNTNVFSHSDNVYY